MSLLKKALFLIFYTPSLPLFSYFCKRLPGLFLFYFFLNYLSINSFLCNLYIFIEISNNFLLVYDCATFLGKKGGWDKSPSLSIIFGLSSKTQWLSGLYYADFISFYSPTQLCGGGTTKSNSNELPISVPLSLKIESRFYLRNKAKARDKIGQHSSDRFGS